MRGLGRLRRIRNSVQDAIYDIFDLRSVPERIEKRALTKHMGFEGQFDEHRRFQFALIQSLGLKPKSKLLEIGCGPLTLGIPVIGYLDPGGYVGVDVRPEVADQAWIQIGKHGLSAKNPRLVISSDFASKEISEAFDFVWSFSVMYHLTDELVARLFEVVAARLKAEGRFFGQINTSSEESTWLQFPFLKRQPDFYKALSARNGLSMSVVGSLGDLGLQSQFDDSRGLLLEFKRP